MMNQYVNMSPQQRMAQMLQQQQSQQTQLQGQDQSQANQMGTAQNPFSGVNNAINMYGQYDQMAQSGNGLQTAGDMSAQSMPVTGGGYIQPTPLGS